MSNAVSLSTLITPSKTVTFDFPAKPDFSVDVCFLSRESILSLRKKCLNSKFNRKTRQAEEELDEELFLSEYTKATIKGWKGLKYSYLEELLLVDIKDLDPNECLPFNLENAQTLIKNSVDFESWISDIIGDLQNFTTSK